MIHQVVVAGMVPQLKMKVVMVMFLILFLLKETMEEMVGLLIHIMLVALAVVELDKAEDRVTLHKETFQVDQDLEIQEEMDQMLMLVEAEVLEMADHNQMADKVKQTQ